MADHSHHAITTGILIWLPAAAQAGITASGID
jgi:hypothetical protein